MNVRDLTLALHGQNPQSDVLFSSGGTLYELDHVGSPTADVTVLFLSDSAADSDNANNAAEEMNAAAPAEDSAENSAVDEPGSDEPTDETLS